MPHALQINTEGNGDANDLSVLPYVVGESIPFVSNEKVGLLVLDNKAQWM